MIEFNGFFDPKVDPNAKPIRDDQGNIRMYEQEYENFLALYIFPFNDDSLKLPEDILRQHMDHKKAYALYKCYSVFRGCSWMAMPDPSNWLVQKEKEVGNFQSIVCQALNHLSGRQIEMIWNGELEVIKGGVCSDYEINVEEFITDPREL